MFGSILKHATARGASPHAAHAAHAAAAAAAAAASSSSTAAAACRLLLIRRRLLLRRLRLLAVACSSCFTSALRIYIFGKGSRLVGDGGLVYV